MRKKRSVWKRIRWFLLTEIVTLIVIAIVAQVIYNDTKKSVKLEVESRMDFAASEAKGQRKESADQLLRFTFLIQELFLGEPFWQYDKDFDPAAWFRDSDGIVRDPQVPVERVVIRAFGKEVFYLRDLPLHHSQKEITTTEEYSDFELTLRPTADFLSPLLSRGSAIMIIEPQRLADDIKRVRNDLRTGQDYFFVEDGKLVRYSRVHSQLKGRKTQK